MEFTFKIVLIGDMQVGKTSIRERYMGEGFPTHYMPTLGADFSIKDIDLETAKIRWMIWDLAGHHTFSVVRERYYYGAVGALVVYDITNKESFDHIPLWIDEFWKNSFNNKKFPILLIGNKIDLEWKRKVMEEQIAEYLEKLNQECHSYGFHVDHIYTSAKNNININDAFKKFAQILIDFVSKTERRIK